VRGQDCTNQTVPTLGFSMRTRDGQDITLTMEPDDYMDRELSEARAFRRLGCRLLASLVPSFGRFGTMALRQRWES